MAITCEECYKLRRHVIISEELVDLVKSMEGPGHAKRDAARILEDAEDEYNDHVREYAGQEGHAKSEIERDGGL